MTALSPAPRYPLEYPITLYSTKNGPARQISTVTQATSKNLSETGLNLLVEDLGGLENGAEVLVLLHYGENKDQKETLPLRGQIVWTQGDRAGVQILEPPKDIRLFYLTLIDGFESLLSFSPIGHLNFD